MYQASQQLQGVPETLTAGIEEIVGEQIKLISTQVDLSEKLSVLIRQVCASDDEVNALCDHVLGLNSGTGSTPEDVFLCLVLYPAALQYAKDPKITCKLKVSFYQQYLNPAIQCAWKFLSKSLFSSYPKCDGSEISQKAGMAVMKMGTMDSRGRIHGHMACTYVSPYPSFCDLYLGLYQFANFLLRNYNGRPDNFCMGNNVDQAQEFLRSLQSNSCHQPKANNGHLQLNADECNDNDGGDNTNDKNDEYDDDDDCDDDDKEQNKKAKTVTPDRPKRKVRHTKLNQVRNKKVRVNNNGSSIMADHFECDASSDDNDGGSTMALLTKYCKAAGAVWDPKKLLMYTKSEEKLEIVESTILRATTFKQIASTLNSAYIKDGKVWMDVLDENKFRNSPLVSAFLLVNLVR